MHNAIGDLRDYLKGLRSLPAGALLETIKRFGNERSGNVALLFGLTLVPLTFLIGMGLDFSNAVQKKALLDAAADAAVLAAVTPAMLAQPDAASITAAENMFNAQASAISGLSYEAPTVTVSNSGLTRTVTVNYTASSINSFGGVLGMATWPISSGTGTGANNAPPQAVNSGAPNINFYLLLDNSPSMDLPATSAGITAMINATKNAPSSGANAGGCAFACHESNPAADNLGNPGGIDNYQLAQNLGVVTRIQNMASATQSLMTTAAATETSNNATYQAAIYTFNGSSGPNVIQTLTPNLTQAQAAATNINVLEVCQNNDLVCGTNNNDTDTDFENAISYINNNVMKAPGTGAANSTPQEVLFIVTDGVDDEISSTCSQKADGNRCQQPFNTTWCTTVKNRGILIAVLYTEYLPLPTSGTGSNSWYNSYVAPYQSQIGPNLQNCASAGLYFSVTTDGDITSAMNTLFQQAVTTARLVQ
jgi:Flp pilus assembly protein TadG